MPTRCWCRRPGRHRVLCGTLLYFSLLCGAMGALGRNRRNQNQMWTPPDNNNNTDFAAAAAPVPGTTSADDYRLLLLLQHAQPQTMNCILERWRTLVAVIQ